MPINILISGNNPEECSKLALVLAEQKESRIVSFFDFVDRNFIIPRDQLTAITYMSTKGKAIRSFFANNPFDIVYVTKPTAPDHPRMPVTLCYCSTSYFEIKNDGSVISRRGGAPDIVSLATEQQFVRPTLSEGRIWAPFSPLPLMGNPNVESEVLYLINSFNQELGEPVSCDYLFNELGFYYHADVMAWSMPKSFLAECDVEAREKQYLRLLEGDNG